MLAASELGITRSQLKALITVRDLLTEATLTYHPRDEIRADRNVPVRAFNMDMACAAHGCGTAACIGGWMHIIDQGIPAVDGVYHLSPEQSESTHRLVMLAEFDLSTLFFPNRDGTLYRRISYDSITPAEAVAAIDNFLEHGTPRWGSVLKHRL